MSLLHTKRFCEASACALPELWQYFKISLCCRQVALALPWPTEWAAKLSNTPIPSAGSINSGACKNPGTIFGSFGPQIKIKPAVRVETQLLTDFQNSSALCFQGHLSKRSKQIDIAKAAGSRHHLQPDNPGKNMPHSHLLSSDMDQTLGKGLKQLAVAGDSDSQVICPELGNSSTCHPGSCTSIPSATRGPETLHRGGHAVGPDTNSRSLYGRHSFPDGPRDGGIPDDGHRGPVVVPGLQASFYVEKPFVGDGYTPTCRIKLRQHLSGGVSLSGAASFGSHPGRVQAACASPPQQSAPLRRRCKRVSLLPLHHQQLPFARPEASCSEDRANQQQQRRRRRN